MNKKNTILSVAELSLCKGQAITQIKIADNLTQFPEEIFDYAQTLEVLDLSNNQLSELPEKVSQLTALKILFLSKNQFTKFPKVLYCCPKLTMIGFKSNQITDIPENALPVNTRWLILTDNTINKLPKDIGQLRQLQKCMLAGNALTELPNTLAQCQSLQLLRLSANQLLFLPSSIKRLSSLAWLAIAGNPFSSGLSLPKTIPQVSMSTLELGPLLGEGASGLIYKAALNTKECAVKLFKGDVTSDGYPEDELLACLFIPPHPSLVKVIAHIDEPDSRGVVMELIPEKFKNLGLPPSLESCTRDVFNDSHCFDKQQVMHIVRQMADVLQHIHKHHFIHGDIYAHNVLVDMQGNILFGDMGAASYIGGLNTEQKSDLLCIEYRALAYFIEDIIDHCASVDVNMLSKQHALQKVYTLCQKTNGEQAVNSEFLKILLDLL